MVIIYYTLTSLSITYVVNTYLLCIYTIHYSNKYCFLKLEKLLLNANLYNNSHFSMHILLVESPTLII